MQTASSSRDEMIAEWLRGNEAFKRLARQYGKTPAKAASEDGRGHAGAAHGESGAEDSASKSEGKPVLGSAKKNAGRAPRR